mmetsp:Transcript_29037/g.96415  ORF Transcript_29037/g.96415 Transcript_29037/m.96415 type:complete len:204 (+) Transcript_29037:902-1513(+)
MPLPLRIPARGPGEMPVVGVVEAAARRVLGLCQLVEEPARVEKGVVVRESDRVDGEGEGGRVANRDEHLAEAGVRVGQPEQVAVQVELALHRVAPGHRGVKDVAEAKHVAWCHLEGPGGDDAKRVESRPLVEAIVSKRLFVHRKHIQHHRKRGRRRAPLAQHHLRVCRQEGAQRRQLATLSALGRRKIVPAQRGRTLVGAGRW